MNGKTIVEWWVRVEGEQQDLFSAADNFSMNTTCLIERDQDGSFYLKSERLKDIDDGWHAKEVGENMLSLVNGSLHAFFDDYLPLRVSGVVPIHEDGSRSVVILAEAAHFQFRAGRATVTVSGGAPPEPEPAEPEQWVELSQSNQHVADVLQYMSRDANWFDLYKAYEAVRNALGGEPKMLKALSKNSADPNAFRAQIKRFRHTANTIHDIRHHRSPQTPPTAPMLIEEAEETIRDLIKRFLQHQTSSP